MNLVAMVKPQEIFTEDHIEDVFDVKTSIINNPLTNTPLVVYRN